MPEKEIRIEFDFRGIEIRTRDTDIGLEDLGPISFMTWR